MIVLYILLAALAYRIRGGFLPQLTFGKLGVGRAIFALTIGGLLLITNYNNPYLILTVLGMFGAVTLGHGRYTDLGRYTPGWLDETDSWDWLIGKEKEGDSFYKRWTKEALALLADGLVHFLPFLFIGSPYILLMFPSKLIAFEAAQQLGKVVNFNKMPPGLKDAHEIGEALFGASLGIAAYLSL